MFPYIFWQLVSEYEYFYTTNTNTQCLSLELHLFTSNTLNVTSFVFYEMPLSKWTTANSEYIYSNRLDKPVDFVHWDERIDYILT